MGLFDFNNGLSTNTNLSGGLGAAASGISALFSILGGFSANSAAHTEAGYQRGQADLVNFDAQQQAGQTQREADQVAGQQQVDYAASGVSGGGSPLLVLAQTHALATQQVNTILNRGKLQAGLLRIQAGQTENKGRSALLGNLTTGAADVFSKTAALNKPTKVGQTSSKDKFFPPTFQINGKM